MTETAAILASALQADVETMRLLSLNVANADSVGYRRAVPVLRASYSAAAASVENVPAAAVVPVVVAASDPAAGTLRQTGNTLDVAIEGAGFLVLDGASGEELSRQGNFLVDAEGFLAASDGARVLGQKGPIHVGAALPVIDPDGTVRLEGQATDRLRMAAISGTDALTVLPSGRYVVASGSSSMETGNGLVRQGFLEGSNVQPVNEMVRVIETLRHFEALQRSVRAYDDMLKTGISELGKI